MRRGLLRLLSLAALIAAAPGAGSEAEAAPVLGATVVGLAPADGYGTWTATNEFRFTWGLVGVAGGLPPERLAFRFRDASGDPVGPEYRVAEPSLREMIARIPGPPAPEPVSAGAYGFELWLESGLVEGPRSSTTVYFDDTRPAPPRLVAPDEWLREGGTAELQIGRPEGPPPPSGIAGYAAELDHGSGGGPCGDHGRCAPQEVDLGADGGTVSVGPLREQVNVVRVSTVSGSGMASAQSESAELRVDGTPPLVKIEQVPAGWSSGAVPLTAKAIDTLSGMAGGGPAGALTAIAVDGAIATVATGDSASAVVHGEGVHEVGAYARDAIGNFSTGGGDSSPPTLARVRIDESAPRVSFTSYRDPAEPERIVATISDALSGPDPERGSIALRPAGSAQSFEAIATRVAPGTMTAVWDSDGYPPGRYEFRASGYDLAGNRTTTLLRDDGVPLVLVNPLKTPTGLSFGFGGRQLVWHRCQRSGNERRCRRQVIKGFERRPGSRIVPYGRGIPVSGRLTSAGGLPLANLPVQVTETFDAGGAPAARETTALTGADGVFVVHLPPGPSRRIEVTFAGNRVLTRSGGRGLRLGVRAAVLLRSSSATAAIGGAPVVFSGAVGRENAAIPATGLPVELQFRLPGMPWSEFRNVQTGPEGRFRDAYDFSDDDSRGVRFQFRARLAAQPGWPFEPGTSRPIGVTGR
jgi:hypothetical protein